MLKVGVSMVRSFGLTTTMEYFVNGLFSGVSNEQGISTMNDLCNAISNGNKESFETIMSNSGSQVASLSFPVGNPFNDVDSAWQAVQGIAIELNGDINTSGVFASVPVNLLLPFPAEGEKGGEKTQFASSIIRMEFEMAKTKPNPKTTTKSYNLKAVEFFFDF